MGKLSSWNCHGCTNVCYRLRPDGEVAQYCRPAMETGTQRKGWTTPDHLECLDKTDDPSMTDNAVKIWSWPFGQANN